MLLTTEVTCGRKAPGSLIDSGLKKRRRSTSATSSLLTGTGVFFHLAAKDFGHFSQQFVAKGVLLPRIGGEQRGHHGAAVHFYDRLREVLEKVDQAPARISRRLRPERGYTSIPRRVVPSVERSSCCGLDSSSTTSGSAGGVSRSASLPSAWMSLRPSAPAS